MANRIESPEPTSEELRHKMRVTDTALELQKYFDEKVGIEIGFEGSAFGEVAGCADVADMSPLVAELTKQIVVKDTPINQFSYNFSWGSYVIRTGEEGEQKLLFKRNEGDVALFANLKNGQVDYLSAERTVDNASEQGRHRQGLEIAFSDASPIRSYQIGASGRRVSVYYGIPDRQGKATLRKGDKIEVEGRLGFENEGVYGERTLFSRAKVHWGSAGSRLPTHIDAQSNSLVIGDHTQELRFPPEIMLYDELKVFKEMLHQVDA